VAGDTITRFLNWQDRATSVLFGDGAGAVVLEADKSEGGVLSALMGCQGDAAGLLTIRGHEADPGAFPKSVVRMQGNEVFRLAIRGMRQAALQALAKADLSVSAIDQVIAHQANARILQRLRADLGFSADKMFVNVERYGNTGAGSVAIALSEFAGTGAAQPGSTILLVAFGGGLTWAATVFRWADIDAVVARRCAVQSQSLAA
jgi:3-oxoacyl-[acyl-carrier-protein] synthase-3